MGKGVDVSMQRGLKVQRLEKEFERELEQVSMQRGLKEREFKAEIKSSVNVSMQRGLKG